jgi:hypothetical protein
MSRCRTSASAEKAFRRIEEIVVKYPITKGGARVAARLRPAARRLRRDEPQLMNSFAMIFGKCVWIPPSPAAAFLALSYFYGVAPGVPAARYEDAMRGQFVAAGASRAAAAAEVKWLDDCFASYVVPKHPQRSQTR